MKTTRSSVATIGLARAFAALKDADIEDATELAKKVVAHLG